MKRVYKIYKDNKLFATAFGIDTAIEIAELLKCNSIKRKSEHDVNQRKYGNGNCTNFKT